LRVQRWRAGDIQKRQNGQRGRAPGARCYGHSRSSERKSLPSPTARNVTACKSSITHHEPSLTQSGRNSR
jgi:hypothetical protein